MDKAGRPQKRDPAAPSPQGGERELVDLFRKIEADYSDSDGAEEPVADPPEAARPAAVAPGKDFRSVVMVPSKGVRSVVLASGVYKAVAEKPFKTVKIKTLDGTNNTAEKAEEDQPKSTSRVEWQPPMEEQQGKSFWGEFNKLS